jgi:two-component system sensor histidine kinase BaeS
VSNLLANALRATPAGGSIHVRAGRDPAGVEVLVEDTGSGIAADVLPHVFDRFWKSADSRGSGLGLAIARNLVRGHDGTIDASSDGPGQGTTVRFTLPTSPP